MVADIEARARLAGAEEVFVGINPDPGRSSAFLRCDRLGALGARFAIRLSLSLNGSWVRRTITCSGDLEEQSTLATADAAFHRALASSSAPAALKALHHDFPGKITAWHAPGGPGVRIDTAAYAEYVIPPYYDSLIAKLIVHGSTRDEAIRRMDRALDMFVLEGVKSTIPLHRQILRSPEFQKGDIYTKFLEHMQDHRARAVEMA